MSAISTAGGRTGRYARLVRRRSLPHATTVATSLRRRCSVGSITSTIWPHDQPDGDFAPYKPKQEGCNVGEQSSRRKAVLAYGPSSGSPSTPPPGLTRAGEIHEDALIALGRLF